MERRTGIVLGACLAGLLALAVLQNERNRLAMTNSSGSVSSGTKFGVSIGDEIDPARQHLLASGFTQLLTPSDLQQLNYPLRNEYVFRDGAWRRGTVRLRVSEGKVAAIAWHYQLGAP